jgi:hypothetical protein
MLPRSMKKDSDPGYLFKEFKTGEIKKAGAERNKFRK